MMSKDKQTDPGTDCAWDVVWLSSLCSCKPDSVRAGGLLTRHASISSNPRLSPFRKPALRPQSQILATVSTAGAFMVHFVLQV
eukprot:3137994-Rhodomonas_salina.3